MIEVKTVTTKHTKTECRVASGDVESCCHTVHFFYNVGDSDQFTEEDLEALEEEAERRATEMISQGYWSGNLCCMLMDPERELHGSWSIPPKE